MDSVDRVGLGAPSDKVSSPASLYILIARRAPLAVILRRGPSKWVQVILWHTDSDTFIHGQWFHGRIYEQSCDLSSNGKLFIYFALKINRHTLHDPHYTFAWTAISRPPYLTALVLWPQDNTNGGGGLFLDEHTIKLSHLTASGERQEGRMPLNVRMVVQEATSVSRPAAFRRNDDERLARDGWELRDEGVRGIYQRRTGWIGRIPTVWQKSRAPGGYRLLRVVDAGSNQRADAERQAYILEDVRQGSSAPIEGATWADWDHQDRLVFARQGRLYASSGSALGTAAEMLADFNQQRPYELSAPKWAEEW